MPSEDPMVLSVSRTINAPATEIFSFLADSHNHLLMDGTNMLRVARATEPLSGVGDVFVMDMYNDRMGDYVMTNLVVEFEANRRLVWEPSRVGAEDDSWHHRWGYELDAVDDSTTVVSELYDVSRCPEEALQIMKGGTVWLEGMAKSLEKLDELCTRGTTLSTTEN